MGTKSSDFDPSALTQKTDEHTKILTALEKRVGTNENFGKTFADSAADSMSLRNAVGGIVNDLLQHDTATQTAVGGVVKSIDSRQFKGQLVTLGKIVLWVLSIIATVIITNIFNKD